MTFKYAAAYQIPMGKYRGQKLDEIAETTEGLLYLDWLSGQEFIYGDCKDAVIAYVQDPSIQVELSKEMGAVG